MQWQWMEDVSEGEAVRMARSFFFFLLDGGGLCARARARAKAKARVGVTVGVRVRGKRVGETEYLGKCSDENLVWGYFGREAVPEGVGCCS